MATRRTSSGSSPATRPPTTAPASEGGAIHANSLQLTRPARAWVQAEATAAAPEIATLAPAPAAGEVENWTTTGSRRLPSTRPTSPPTSETTNAQTPTTISSHASMGAAS